MGLREKFEDKIKKKELEIQEYEMKIREARAYVQALQDHIKFLPKEDMANDATDSNTLRPGSMPYRAHELLKKAGRPLHVSDILTGIGEEPTKPNRVSLSGTLASYVRNHKIFSRPMPNTFGLISLERAVSTEPPEDFGLPSRKDDNDD
ncbi:MAG TPA: hypothetical protein PKM17_14030 [Syntrophorhabdus sp.]|nr:hypothetical protein [Syntrophorhabdus sp.]